MWLMLLLLLRRQIGYGLGGDVMGVVAEARVSREAGAGDVGGAAAVAAAQDLTQGVVTRTRSWN